MMMVKVVAVVVVVVLLSIRNSIQSARALYIPRAVFWCTNEIGCPAMCSSKVR